MKFLKTPAYRFRVNGRNGGFFENDDVIHRFSIVLVFSCGRAKTIRIRQRILRKYSEVKKNTHTLLCQTWQSTGIFKYIFKGHCPDYAHARRTFIFFLQKELSRFCRSLGRLATLKASSTRLTAFVKVNSSQRSICGTSQHLSSL